MHAELQGLVFHRFFENGGRQTLLGCISADTVRDPIRRELVFFQTIQLLRDQKAGVTNM